MGGILPPPKPPGAVCPVEPFGAVPFGGIPFGDRPPGDIPPCMAPLAVVLFNAPPFENPPVAPSPPDAPDPKVPPKPDPLEGVIPPADDPRNDAPLFPNPELLLLLAEAACDIGVPTVGVFGLGGFGGALVGSQLNSHSE